MASLHDEPPPEVAPRYCGNNVVAPIKVSAPNASPVGNFNVSAPTAKEYNTIASNTTMESAPKSSPASIPLCDGNDTILPVGKLNLSTPIPLLVGNIWNNMNKVTQSIENSNVFFKFQPSLSSSFNGNIKEMIKHALQVISVNDFMSSQKDKIAPTSLVANKGSVITYYYDDRISLKDAKTTTRTLKSAIESAYRSTKELRFVGVQDTNISYKATNGKEVAIWFDKILTQAEIDEVNFIIFKAISLSTDVGPIYGFPNPVKRYTWVYRLQKIVGFTRKEMMAAFVRDGLRPDYFRIMYGALDTNALKNEIGEYARVILSLEEGAPHLEKIMVDTNRGTFALPLKVRDDTHDLFTSTSYTTKEEVITEPSKNPKYKTAHCYKFRDNKFCPLGEKCGFAHGEHEIRLLQSYAKEVLPHVVQAPMSEDVNHVSFPSLISSATPAKVNIPLAANLVPGLQLGDDVPAEMNFKVVESSNETEESLSEEEVESENVLMVMSPDGPNTALMSESIDIVLETIATDSELDSSTKLSPNQRKKKKAKELKLRRKALPVAVLPPVSTPLSPAPGKIKVTVFSATQQSRGKDLNNSTILTRNLKGQRMSFHPYG